jgi:2-methylaconitate cis-trans-isomerase PrpF
LPPPQSVFVIPKKPTEGKDPFFPNATRVYASDTPVKMTSPVVPVGDLSLKGISGTAAEPLAIINTTTFTTGEENDVITSAGRMRIRCVAINMGNGTVLVQAGGERRELRLQPKK